MDSSWGGGTSAWSSRSSRNDESLNVAPQKHQIWYVPQSLQKDIGAQMITTLFLERAVEQLLAWARVVTEATCKPLPPLKGSMLKPWK
eukprot:1265507-Amphidinium_carterae.1